MNIDLQLKIKMNETPEAPKHFRMPGTKLKTIEFNYI